jgi:ABC-type Mn2+/Zn2+ transport system permease subunit
VITLNEKMETSTTTIVGTAILCGIILITIGSYLFSLKVGLVVTGIWSIIFAFAFSKQKEKEEG